jgi:hypothetical protein
MPTTSSHGRTAAIGMAVVLAFLVLIALSVGAGTASAKKRCVAADAEDVTPTTTAPDWYEPGKTKLCEKAVSDDGGIEIQTVNWVAYVTEHGATRFRSNPDNADYSAKDCELSFRTCGEKIIGDAYWFWDTCSGRGLTGSIVARNIRYWADRARANGPGWRVYTFTETGGYPYSCAFSVVQLY